MTKTTAPTDQELVSAARKYSWQDDRPHFDEKAAILLRQLAERLEAANAKI